MLTENDRADLVSAGLAIVEARAALTEAVRSRHRLWADLCEDNTQAEVARACGVLRQAVAQGVLRVTEQSAKG